MNAADRPDPVSRDSVRELVGAEIARGLCAGPLHGLCRVLSRRVVAGAELCVMTPTGPSLVGVDDPMPAAGLVERQATAGEGPIYTSYATRRPVLVPDLATEGPLRWPGLSATDPPLRLGAVFVFPLAVGATVTGALQLTRTPPGPLSRTEITTALTFAEVATELMLDAEEDRGRRSRNHQPNQSTSDVPSGESTSDRQTSDDETSGDRPTGDASSDAIESIIGHHQQVYQAQGMVMAQHQISLDQALSRMRAHAFATSTQLPQVAADIVAGRLRLEHD